MLKVALVGCGAVICNYYKAALEKLQSQGVLEVRALLDPSRLALEKLQPVFPSAKVFTDLSGLSKSEADFAIVASPPFFHAEQAATLLKAGVAVLCEKPMALTAAQAQTMITAASEGPLLVVSRPRRFMEKPRAIKKVLEERSLGKALSFSFVEGVRFSWQAQSDTFFKKSSSGGGVWMDLGPHVLDLLIWWLGEPSEIVCRDDAMGGVEANAVLSCRFKDVEGKIFLSRERDLPSRCEIICEKGSLSWDLSSMDIPRAMEEQLRVFVQALKGGESGLAQAREALKTVEWLKHAYQTARLVPMGWLPQAEWEAAVKLRK